MRYLPTLLIGFLGAGILVSLGVWQVQRLHWKGAILEDLDQRIEAAPVALPERIDPVADRYLPVHVSGTTGEQSLHVLVSTKKLGAGFRIVTSLETAAGRRVLLDRGFVSADQKDMPMPPMAIDVTGNLHWPEERDSFTPENDPVENYWFARDVSVMADALQTEPVLVVTRQSSETDLAATPLPVDSSGVPNDHLGYAVTWFGMALVWLGMTALLLWRISRRNP